MAKGGGGNESNIEIYIIAFFVALAIIFFAYKYFYHELIMVWKHIRIVESYAFIWMTYIIPGQWKPQFIDIISFLRETHHESMSGDTVRMVDSHIKPYIGPIIGALVFLMGSRMSNKSINVSRRMNINDLLKDRSHVFPHLQDYAEYDPNEDFIEYQAGNAHSMIHAAPLTPEEYCLMNPPIGLEEKAKKRKDYRRTIWDKKDRFDIDLAKESLESQLGPQFNCVSKLDGENNLVFDYLNAKVKISRDEVYNMAITLINKVHKKTDLSWAEDQVYHYLTRHPKKKGREIPFNYKLDKDSVRKIFNTMKKSPELTKSFITLKSEGIMAKHAYQSSALVALMKESSSRNNFSLNVIRNRVKEANRPLYYALNCTGRSGSFIECCGIIAHYTFELDTNEPCITPQVDLAIIHIQRELGLVEEE